MKNSINIKLKTLKDVSDFIAICNSFNEDIDYSKGRYVVDAKSLLGVNAIGLSEIVEVSIKTDDKNTINDLFSKLNKWRTSK